MFSEIRQMTTEALAPAQEISVRGRKQKRKCEAGTTGCEVLGTAAAAALFSPVPPGSLSASPLQLKEAVSPWQRQRIFAPSPG